MKRCRKFFVKSVSNMDMQKGGAKEKNWGWRRGPEKGQGEG
jgi:hypothetical protein